MKAASVIIPKRDFIILPLISLLTILVPVALAEAVTRLAWVESGHDDCLYFDALGARHKPFCASRTKNVEGPWVLYKYDACGYRGTQSCGPKPPGTQRIVIMGTSMAFGLNVPEDELFSTRSAPELSRLLGRRIEFENLGSIGPPLPLQFELLDEVRGLQPDAVFLLLVPYDLKSMDIPATPSPVPAGKAHRSFPRAFDLAYYARSSRALFTGQHFLLADKQFAERAFLMSNDPDDTARIPESSVTQQRFERLGVLIQRLVDGLRGQGISLFVIPLPSRLQAILLSGSFVLPGVDAAAFPRHVGAIARSAGAEFIDVVPQVKRAAAVESMFYPVDGHLTGEGHRIVAESVVEYFRHSSP